MAMRKLFAAAAVLGVGVVGAVGAAGAEPGDAEGFDLTCGGSTVQIVPANGHGEFTPAHVLGSSTTFVPVEFGGVSGTIFDAAGNVVASFSEDFTVSKNAQARGRQIQDCTFGDDVTFVATAEDAAEIPGLVEGETYRDVFEGQVSGYFTGRP